MNAVKIQLYNGSSYATDVFFDSQEIDTILPEYQNDIIEVLAHHSEPVIVDRDHLSDEGDSREPIKITINFFILNANTRTKLLSVFNNQYKVKVYYEYDINASNCYEMVCSQNREENYNYGINLVSVIESLVFYGEVE